jgi:ketosteroid isomerase-like protein
MKAHGSKPTVDETEILALFERWSKAVREGNRARIRQDHDANILMFDVPPPFGSRGIEDYIATWETFFAASDEPVTFHFTDVEITAGSEVAFVTAVGHCVTTDKAGRPEPLDFRLPWACVRATMAAGSLLTSTTHCLQCSPWPPSTSIVQSLDRNAARVRKPMSDSEKRWTGGCLCGVLRYEAVGEPLFAGLCCCADCRKASGSGFVPFLGFSSEAVRFTSRA